MSLMEVAQPTAERRAPTRGVAAYSMPRCSLLIVGTLLCVTSALSAQRGPNAAARVSAVARVSAWSLPEPNELIERVFTRIVTQDKPGAMPIGQFERRTVGRKETVDALEEFLGHSVDLAPSAFSAVDGWNDARKLDLPPCEDVSCPITVNAVWLAVTKIEKGATPNVLHVWYATRFVANVGGTSQRQSYAFCERWVRVDNAWKYEGFIKVVTLPDRG